MRSTPANAVARTRRRVEAAATRSATFVVKHEIEHHVLHGLDHLLAVRGLASRRSRRNHQGTVPGSRNDVTDEHIGLKGIHGDRQWVSRVPPQRRCIANQIETHRIRRSGVEMTGVDAREDFPQSRSAALIDIPDPQFANSGLKQGNRNGAARPSGTEDIYKIYAESFRDAAHLQTIVSEAQQIVNNALG